MFFVYKLTHKPTGKSYIGRTDNMELASKSLFEIAKKGAIGEFWDILRNTGASQFEMSNLHATEDMRENDSMFFYYTNEYASYLFMEAYTPRFPDDLAKNQAILPEPVKALETDQATVASVAQENVPEAVLVDPEPILLTETVPTKKTKHNGPVPKMHLMKKPNGDVIRVRGLIKMSEQLGFSYQMIMKNGKTKGWEMLAKNINPEDNPEIPVEEYF